LPLFLEIDNVQKGGITYEDLRSSFNPLNGGAPFNPLIPLSFGDSTGNIYDPAITPNYGSSCINPADPTCFGRIHVEVDGDWMAAGFAGPGSAYMNNNTWANYQGAVDVQGFVYWDGGQCSATSCTQQWHSFNGWELHPLTAWRPHVNTPPNNLGAAFTFSPLLPVAGSPVTFTATAVGGAPPYNYCWTFGDGPSGTLCSLQTLPGITHTYAGAGTFTITLMVTDTSNPQQSVTASSQVTVVNPTPPLSASFGFSPGQPFITQTITFSSSISGGITPYTVSWQFGDGTAGTGLSTTNAYAVPGTYTVVMTVTDSANPPNAASVTKTVQVRLLPPPQLVAGFVFSPKIGITGQPITFTSVITGGTPPYGFSWNFGDGSTVSASPNPIHTYTTPGNYNITLTVSDAANGQSSMVDRILVQNAKGIGGGGFNIFLTLLQPWAILTTSGIGLLAAGVVTGARRPRSG
jgi:PKD repeat protein